MAIKRPDIYEHNNPNFAIADSDFVRGGIRTAVADLTALYALAPNVDQLKEHSTIVYVSGETKYYILVDITNVDNVSGWNEFQTGSGSGTITGGTNGLSTSGANIILGGTLLSGTTINADNNDLSITNINDFQVKTSGDTTVLGVDNEGFLLSTTGGSVTFDDGGGLKYGGDYRSEFIGQSIPDVNYVTGLTSGNVDILTFTGYTATTQSIIDKTITGGTNGLVSGGRKVGLGGNLTGDTTISGLDSHKLIIEDLNEFNLSTLGTSVIFNNIDGFRYGSGYTSSHVNWLTTKGYVDSVAIGLNVHQAVLVATTGNTVLSGLTTIDGITLTGGERVLVKNQTNAVNNGIYIVTGVTWQRSSDYDFNPSSEIANGDLIPVTSGQTQFNSLWSNTSSNPIISGDTIQFTLFSLPTKFVGGVGIDVTGNTISLEGSSLVGNSIVWSADTFNVDVNSGTLQVTLGNKLETSIFETYTGDTETILNNKLETSIFETYTGNTSPIIDNAITGATNFGTGTPVYSGSTGRNLQFNTITGSGGTIVQKVGNEIIINTPSISSGQQYSGETPSAVDLCGIHIGYELTGKTVSCIIQDLLVPDLCGDVCDPTISIDLTFSGNLEIGCNISQTVEGTFGRGSIDPQYCSLSPFRSGLPISYSFTGTGMPVPFQACTISPASETNASYTVTGGSQSWGVCTYYDTGVPALSSKGTEYCAALVTNCTNQATDSIIGILPWYWGTKASSTITGGDVAAGNKVVANVIQSTPITYNAITEFMWFAAPTGTYTDKTKWWVCAANAGTIGGVGDIWADSCLVTVTSAQACWTGCSYDVYVTCGINSTAAGIPMCLYY